MENKMQSFTSDKFGTIRIVEEDGKALFRATDVAKSLGYGNPHEALYRHCKYLVKREVPNPQSVNGKMVEALFIPEGDLYRLITHSKLPEAQAFESWVFDEVLPSIRRHGGYIDGQDTLMKYMDDKRAKEDKVFDHPTLMKTPVVRNGKQATAGYHPEIWESWE